MIAIIDYDAGNLKSVEKALVHLGEEVVITREKKLFIKKERVDSKAASLFLPVSFKKTKLHLRK